MNFLYAGLSGLVLTLVLTPLVKRFALRHSVVDYPSLPRKKHAGPVPLLGGLSIFLSFSIVTVVFWSLGLVSDAQISSRHIIAILISGIILIFGGWLDDRFHLSPSRQFIFPVIAIIPILWSGIGITAITNPFGGVFVVMPLLGTIGAGLWILGLIYTTKFLDGLDGLVAGITTITALTIFIVSLFWDVPQSGTSILALILAGSCLGFLVFNWHPAKIFLGEGGSTFCGFTLGVLAIISGSKIATTLLVMGIPILDVVWVITRRLWQRNAVSTGDRNHLHFQLLDLGMSHRQTVLLLYAITLFFGVSSLFLQTKGKIIALLGVAVVMIIFILAIVMAYKKKVNRTSQP